MTTLPQTDERSTTGAAVSYYELLQVAPDASFDEIDAAYRRQQELFDPAHAAVMGEEFLAVAETRRAALDQAHGVLRDPQRRFEYDRQLGLLGDEKEDRRGITNREITFAVAGILAALLILTGLWYAMGSRTTSGPAVVEVNQPAIRFDLRTMDGKRFDLQAQRGKVVLVNFWGSWCEPCKEETPALQAAHEKLAAEGLVIVGVDLLDQEPNYGGSEQRAREFARRFGVEYPIAFDETGQVARDYKLYPIPVSYFIDPDGNLRYIRIGQLRTADVERLFRDLWQQHLERRAG